MSGCNSNRNTIADLRNEIRRCDAEIELLKEALLEAESREFVVELPRYDDITFDDGQFIDAREVLDICRKRIEAAGGRCK